MRRLYVDLEASAPPARPRSRAELLLHAQAYIAANLGDAGLDPEQVAHACFISTRYLHRVFGEEGFSVCESIRTARLDRCRRDLINPSLADEPISMIASRWGLPNLPHFSRLFRAAFGCSAREFRRHAAQARRESTDELPDRRVPALGSPADQLEHARAWVAAGREPTIP
ncbi:MAG: helix-turn-helix domain-containing protein [Solirubrobacteraceae bacterium]